MVKTPLTRVLFRHTLSKVLMGVFAAFIGFSIIVSVFSLVPRRAHAAASTTLNFQARLLSSTGAVVPDGTYNVEFKIYNALTSAGSSQGSCTGDTACLWTETRTGANRVQVRAGYLSVYLGDVTGMPSDIWTQQLFLTMNIGGTGGAASWDGEMSPRLRLTAVPAAFSLTQYNPVTGFTSTLSIAGATGGDQTFTVPNQGAAGSYTLLTQNAANASYIQNQNSVDQTADFRITGTGRAATMQATLFDTATATVLNIGTTNATGINLNQSTTLAVDKTLSLSAAASTTALQNFRVTGDTNPRFTVAADGTLSWGPGSGSTDATLSRTASGVLSVAGALTTGTGFNTGSSLSVNTTSAGSVGATIRASSAQTADLLRITDSNSTILSGFNADGDLFTNGTANVLSGLAYPRNIVVSNVGTAGSTTYGYRVSAVNVQGETIASPTVTTATGNITLSGVNFNRITWNASAGATSYKVYGRTSGSELLMATVPSSGATSYNYDDTGAVTPSGALPTGSGFEPMLKVVSSNTTANILQIYGKNGVGDFNQLALSVDVGGHLATNSYVTISNTLSSGTTALTVQNIGATTTATVVKGASGQTGDLLQLQDSNNNVYSSFNGQGNQLTLGTAGTSLLGGATAQKGKLVFGDGSLNGWVTTLQTNALTVGSQIINIPDTAGAGGTICLQNSTACGFAPASGANYIAKNSHDTSSASYVGNLLDLTNSNTGAAGVLSLTNAGTNSALSITQSGNPSAGQALIYANNSNGTPSGNLIDLRSGGTSRLTVDVAGNTTLGGTLSVAGITNSGASLNTAQPLNNFVADGNIGLAAATVDIYSTFTINQTTAGRTLSLPNPTTATAGRLIYVANIGSQPFTMHSVSIQTGKAQMYIWNGSAWTATNIDGAGNGVTLIGSINGLAKTADGAAISGNAIHLQTADATNPGLMSAGDQTFGGNKTFNGNVTIGDATTDRLTVTSQIQGQDALVFQGATDNGFTTTFRVTDPTANNIITFPNETGTVCTTGSVCTGYAPSTGGANYIWNGTATQTANFNIQSAAAGSVAATIQGAASQTVNILEVKADGVTNPLLSVGSTGAVTMRNSADSANALSLQNQNGEANVVAGTTNLYTNLITDSSFESGVTGWSAKAGAGAPAQSSAQKLYDSNSLRFTTTGANQGVAYAVTLNASTAYTLVLNVRFSATAGGFVTIGRQEVSGSDITCATAQTAYTIGWARLSCTFTTGATITAPTSIYLIQTDATARTIYIDGVSLTQGVTQGAMLYGQGTLRVNSQITSPIAIRPAEDTTRALSVANAAGTTTVLAVDTVNGNVSVSGTTSSGAFSGSSATGSAFSATATTTGSSFNAGGTAFTTGNGFLFNTTANGLTSGRAINITGAAGGITADFSGSYINVTPTRTLTAAATRTDSGTFLNLTRANTVNNAGATYNVTGALANLQSTCTQTSGTCNDSGVILNLNQQYGSATGTVLNVTGAGTGNLGVFDATNAGANGVSIDIQSNSSSQYVFRATSNNGATTGLNVRADGRVSIGNTSPSAELDVTGNGIFSGTLTSGAHTVQTATVTDDQIIMGVTAGGGARFAGTITNADLTAARTYTLQDNSGIIPLSTAGNSLFFTTSGATSLTLPTSGTVCTTATCATTPASGYYLQQVPTSNTAGAAAANVVSPIDDGIIGLTVNGTTGAAATALSVVQTGAATGIAVSNSSTGTGLTISGSSTGNGASITATNTSGIQANGLSITRNGVGGTTTNLLNIGNTAGTATSLINLTNSGTTTNALAVSSGTFTTGLNLNGATFTNLIDSANFDVANSGNITNSGTYNTNTFNGTALTFGGAGATTIQSAASQTLNITGHANSTWSTDAGTLTLQGFAGTNVNTPNSAAGATSAVALLTGSATVSGNSGAITLTTGNSTAATAGNIALDVGTSAVSNGSILIGTAARAQTITIGNSTGGAIRVGQNGGTVQIDGTNFDVSTAGVVTLAGGQTTDVSTASAATATAITVQPGTSTAATGTGANATIKAGDQSGTTNSTGGTLTLQGGSATGGAGTRTGGNVSIQAGTGSTANGTISIGTAAASTITVGNSSATQVVLQGNASSTFSATNATGTTTLGFAAPSTAGTVTFQLPAGGTGGNTYDVCTTLSVCTGYQAAGSYIGSSLTDNTANALDIQEGTNNYININTTNGSENVSFGNATTNPSYNFLGTGTLSVSGVLSANGGVLFPGDNFLQTSSSNKLSDTTGIILPLYIYPTNVYTNSDYNNVIALAKKYHNVPLTVILNPASGPGSSADANYTAAIARLHGAGVKILGYVDTNYTAVAEATVRSDIDMWRTLYPAVDGIFFDRTTNDANATHYTYYTNLTAYAHSKSYYPTMINPGVAVPQGYFDNKTADIINVYENSSYPSEATMQGDWAGGNSDYNYNRRSAMVYNQGFNYTNLKMMRKYVGNLYLTDSSGANPWATLSTYLETEFRALSTDGDLIVDTLNAQTGVLTASVDTATATTLSLGTTTANVVNISRAGVTTTVQGALSVTQATDFDGNVTIGDATTDRLTVTSQIQGQDALVFQGATDNGFTTTFRVTDPTANNIITFPNETGTVCTTGSVCTGYAPSTGGNYLAKNATDTNSFAVTASDYLYGFTNSSSAVDSGVLSLNNGTNTGNGLYVTASGNPAAGRALIFASNTNASPSGNLIDLQSGSSPTSRFSVSAAGTTTANSTGSNALSLSAATNSTTSSMLQLGGTAISGGSSNGTYIGANPASFTGDFMNLQVNGSYKLRVSNSGAITTQDSFTIPSSATMTNAYNMQLQGTVTVLTGGGSQYGFQNEPRFQPSAAIVPGQAIYGLVNTATLQNSSQNVDRLASSHTHITVNSSYTGTLNSAYAFDVGSPQTNGTLKIGTYAGVNINATNDNGNTMTSGTVNNYQLLIGGLTQVQGAASTGTLNNYGISLAVPSSGTNGTNNNYGLHIQGNGGSGGTTTNYAIYSSSTAASYLNGLLTLNGGLTISTGDNFIFNGDTFTDLTGSGLTVSSNALTVDATSSSGFFRNGGNSFAGAATLGTNDAYNLSFETNSVTRLTVDQSNGIYLGPGVTGATTAMTLAATGGNAAGVAGSALTISGGAGSSATTGSAGGNVTLQGGSAAGTGNNNGGNVTINGGNRTGSGATGTISIGTATTSAVSIGNTSSTFTAESNATANLFNGATAHTVNLATGAAAQSVTIGSTNTSSALTLQAGTGGLSITTQGTGNLAIGNNAVAQNIYIGNTTGTTGITQRVGTGNYSLDGVGASTYELGASTTTGTITVGGTAQTGTLTVGRSTASNTISIGSAVGNTATQTINIGTSTTAGSATNVNIGSATVGAATVLNGAVAGSGVALKVVSNAATNVGLQVDVTGAAANAFQINTSGVGVTAAFSTGGDLYLGYTGGADGSLSSPNVTSGGAASNALYVRTGTSLTGGTGALNLQSGQVMTSGTAGTVTVDNGSGSTTGTPTINLGNTNARAITLGNTSSATTSYGSWTNNATTQSTGVNASINNLNSYSAFVLTATAAGLTYTLGDPTPATAGRIVYISNASSGSNAFTLSPTNGTPVVLSTGTTATMMWSGSRWTYAGTDASTLQNAYTNSTGGTTPEIKVDSTRGGLDIQDANSTINGSLLTVRASNGAGLGTAIFDVNSTATVALTSSNTSTSLLTVTNDSASTNTVASISANAVTTGRGLDITSTGTGLTSGSLLRVSSATTGAVATNGIVSIQATGNYTSTNNVGALSVQANATTAGTVANISGNALTTGVGLHIASTGTGLTTGSLLRVSSATTGALATNGVVSIQATGNYTSTSNTGVLNVVANATTAGTIANISGSALTTGVALNINANNGTAIKTAGNYLFAQGANRTLSVETTAANAAGYNLTISAGTAGTGAAAFAGGALTLQGGAAAGTGNANGGGVTITGGTGVGTGTLGLVGLAPTAFSTAGVQTISTTGVQAITAGNQDNYSTLPITASVAGVIANLGDPAQSVIGRILYVAARSGSNDFTLRLNSARTPIDISMKANSTATLIWNGTDWTAAGASSSTDLQAAYNNTLTSAGGAELVLNAPGGNADGLTIRNNGTTPITGGLLEVQTSIGSNLFSVNNNATEYANNGGAESSTFTMWTGAPAGGTISRYTTAGNNIATGAASVFVDTSAVANTGVRNTLTTSLTANLKYTVSFTARHTSSTVDFNTMDVYYSVDGTAYSVACATGQTVTYGTWKRINCSFTAPSSGITAANAIIIRHSDTTEHDFYIDNLSVTVSADVNHAVDGSVDAPLGTNWAVIGAGSVTRNTSTMYDSSGSVQATTSGVSGRGVYNNLSNGIVPTQSATGVQYRVTAYMRGDGTNGLTVAINYSPNAGTTLIPCTDYSTQSIAASTWTKVTCLFTTNNTAVTTAQLRVTQTAGTATDFYVDALVIALNQNTASNVQIGGGSKGGPATLFTLDRSSTAPIADNNDAYLGSMYYDTTTGRIQCYEADGWGACGASPDNIVNLNPEYTGAVLNGSGVGTMTADFCGNGGGLSVNTSLCSSGQARNFYKWTSPQPTQQTYSIYVTYQLPATFKGFASDDTVRLVGRVDNTSNASVTYEMFKSDGTTVTQCYNGPTETNVITGGGGAANTWYSYGINGNEATGCSFNASSASNFVIFKINMKAQSNASAYVSTLSFTTTGQ